MSYLNIIRACNKITTKGDLKDKANIGQIERQAPVHNYIIISQRPDPVLCLSIKVKNGSSYTGGKNFCRKVLYQLYQSFQSRKALVKNIFIISMNNFNMSSLIPSIRDINN